MGGFWDDAEIISAYTRAQAILDGVLVPVTDLVPDEPEFARQAGYLCHVALTSTLANIIIPNDAEKAWGNDVKGRLWDLLNMSRMYRPPTISNDGGTWFFPCIFYIAEREGHPRGSATFTLRANIGGGDDGQPVVTLMMDHED